MQKSYWMGVIINILAIVIAVILLLVFTVLKHKKGNITSNHLIFFAITCFAIVMLCSYTLIPYIKDYSLVASGSYIEEIATVIEYTYVNANPDGNGQTQYAKPKFYIASKNEYIILYTKDVEVGATYLIRYYPNTKICDVVRRIS